MKKLLFTLFSVLLIGSGQLSAQVHLEILDTIKEKNFEEIVRMVENHYKDRNQGKGTGYKQFKRWEYLNQGRVDKKGRLTNYSANNLREHKRTKGYKSINNSNWSIVAADKYENDEDANGYTGGLGRVNCITVDPANDNIIYVGTPASGIWKTTTGGSNWNNAGATPSWTPLMDDFIGIGVSGIVIDPNSPITNRTIYALTGDGENADTYSVGVYKSTNGGQSWNPTNLAWNMTDYVLPYKLERHPTQNLMYAVTSQGIYKATNGIWNTTPVVTGDFNDIEFYPNAPHHVMYAATGDKIYRSGNYGDTWTQVTNFDVTPGFSQRIELAVVEADASGVSSKPHYVYAVFGGASASGSFSGVYRSEDYGVSFKQRSTTPNILGYAPNGIDWNGWPLGQFWYNLTIAANPDNGEEIHVGAINCWRSQDGGQTWENTAYWSEAYTDPGEYVHSDVHVLEFHNGSLYCGSDGGIYKTTTPELQDSNPGSANLSWEPISYGLQISQVYRLGTHRNPHVGGISYGLQDNGLNKAIFQNGTWNKWVHWYGADGMETVFDPFNDDILYGCYQNGNLQRYNMATNTVESIIPRDANGIPLQAAYWVAPLSISNTDGAITMGYQDIWRLENPSTAGSQDWVNLSETNGQIIGNPAYGFSALEVAPSNSDVIFGAKFNELYMTFDGGNTWTNHSFIHSINSIVFHPTNPQTAWAASNGWYNVSGYRLFKTTDGGATWTDVSLNSTSLPKVSVNCLAYHNGSDNGIYLGTDLGVYYKDDNLTDWVSFSDDLPVVIVTDLEINYCEDKIYAGTYGRGLWESALYESSFSIDLTLNGQHSDSQIYMVEATIQSSANLQSSESVAYQAGESITLEPGALMQPSGEAFFCADIIDPCSTPVPLSARIAQVYDEIIEDMQDEVKREEVAEEGMGFNENVAAEIYIAKQAEMMQTFYNDDLKIYGNPSKGESKLEFTLETEAIVSLNVYNVNGQLVQQLIQKQTYDVGQHHYQLSLSEFEKGIYFIALEYNGQRAIKKLVKL